LKNHIFLCTIFMLTTFFHCSTQAPEKITWNHISSENGDLEVPNNGAQQTASAIFDVDKDGVNDFVITERSEAPAVVWYRYTENGRDRYIVDQDKLRIEAGSAMTDIDGDGDIDVVFGGDAGSNQVWWWENPYPDYDPDTPWTRHLIKNSGANKHHDQLFGDFDGDDQDELVFWNQGAHTLFFAEIPDKPRETGPWELVGIYSYETDGEPEQLGSYPSWKGTNEHEGLAKADIDQDGKTDIVGAGRWFKHIKGSSFKVHVIDENYAFSRSAAGDFISGGRPEVFLVVGDGRAPLMFYEWQDGMWNSRTVIDTVQDGHSIAVLDFNSDGHLDLFNAEMRLGQNPDAATRILLGDGTGQFKDYVVHTGFGLHESQIADLDGDGDFDILGKPYNWDAPRLDIWLQE